MIMAWPTYILMVIFTYAAIAQEQQKPNVAILVYEGVQIIDFAIPFEVFGQYSLNNVYTVAKDSGILTTYMGSLIKANHTFGSHPVPDVLVLPGGSGTRAARNDPETQIWLKKNAAAARYVLTTCTGAFFLIEAGLAEGRRLTTWFNRQEDLRKAVAGSEVVGDEIVVESGNVITCAGTGIEGSLHVLAKLHGDAWTNVVRLNMEHEPVPDGAHVPRVELADLNLPDGLYGLFPWRKAKMEVYDGDRHSWEMRWRFDVHTTLDSLVAGLKQSLITADGWKLDTEKRDSETWTVQGTFVGREGRPWEGRIDLLTRNKKEYVLTASVRKTISLLFIGNSFTYYNDLPLLVGQLIEQGTDGKVSVSTKMVASPGASLKSHWTDGTARQAIRERAWDVVILQEQGRRPLDAPEETRNYLGKFLAESEAMKAIPLVIETWRRENELEHQDSITQAYRDLSGELQFSVVPLGTLFKRMQVHVPSFQIYSPDKSHPSPGGSFVSALMIYRSLSSVTRLLPPFNPALIDFPEAVGQKDLILDIIDDTKLDVQTYNLRRN